MGLGPEMADMTAGGGLEVGRGGATAVCCRIPGGSREAEFSTAAPGLVTGWVGSLGMPAALYMAIKDTAEENAQSSPACFRSSTKSC